MKYKDFSLHFTLKDQPLKYVEDALDGWLLDNSDTLNLAEDDSIVLHHCFLSMEEVMERNLDTDLVDLLDTLTESQVVCWNRATPHLDNSRFMMLQNLKRLGGVAIFVGEIKAGVKEEYDIAQQLEVDIIHIP